MDTIHGQYRKEPFWQIYRGMGPYPIPPSLSVAPVFKGHKHHGGKARNMNLWVFSIIVNKETNKKPFIFYLLLQNCIYHSYTFIIKTGLLDALIKLTINDSHV